MLYEVITIAPGIVEIQTFKRQVNAFAVVPTRRMGKNVLVIEFGKEFPAAFAIPPDKQTEVVERRPRRLITQLLGT